VVLVGVGVGDFFILSEIVTLQAINIKKGSVEIVTLLGYQYQEGLSRNSNSSGLSISRRAQ
jgi:hypothetical protein